MAAGCSLGRSEVADSCHAKRATSQALPGHRSHSADLVLCVPRIPSMVLTSRVALPAVRP